MSEEGVADTTVIDQALQYYGEVAREGPCDLIYIASDANEFPSELADRGFAFLGYDFANYLCTYNSYSVLYCEVIYGSLEEMRRHATRVNDNLLLSSLADVTEIARTRSKLAEKEAGRRLESLEEGECFGAIAIFGCKQGQP